MIRRIRSLAITALVGLLASVGLAACVSAGEASQRSGQTQMHVDGARAESFTSLSQLISASSSVIVGSVTSASTSEMLNSIPWTIQTVDVNQVLAGINPGPAMKVRQLGGTNTVGTQLLSPGATYLLFVVPFHLSQGDQTGEWVVVGAIAGEYRYTVSTQAATRIDPESPDLPASLTSQQLSTALAVTSPAGTAGAPPVSTPTSLPVSPTTTLPTVTGPPPGMTPPPPGNTPTTLPPSTSGSS
jgi:hypothetical protein